MAHCPVTVTDFNDKKLSTWSLVDVSRSNETLQIIVRSDSDAQVFVFKPNL